MTTTHRFSNAWRLAARCGWAACLVGAMLAPTRPAMAVDGIAVTVRHAREEGTIRVTDDRTPGTLMRHDIVDGSVTAARVLYDGAPRAVYVAISPFGDEAAFVAEDGSLGIVSMAGGSARFPGRDEPDRARGTGAVMWPAADGGRWLYYISRDALRRRHADSGRDEYITKAGGPNSALCQTATAGYGRLFTPMPNSRVAVYDLRRGDEDLHASPTWYPASSGVTVAPAGNRFAVIDTAHRSLYVVGMPAPPEAPHLPGYRLDPNFSGIRSELMESDDAIHIVTLDDGPPETDDTLRFQPQPRWAVNSEQWILATQGRENNGGLERSDAVLYAWAHGRRLRVTANDVGLFDRAGGFWERPADGQTAVAAASVEHPVPRQATVVYIDPHRLYVSFNQRVRIDEPRLSLDSGIDIARWDRDETRSALALHLAEPLKANDRLHIDGILDLADPPNALAPISVDVRVPAWPSDPDGLIYRLDDPRATAVRYDEDRVQHPALLRDGPPGGLDQAGWLVGGAGLRTGLLGSIEWGRGAFGQAIHNNAFSIEILLAPGALEQGTADDPARILNFGAHRPNNWCWMLGQVGNRLVFGIRTVDNYLTQDGEPLNDPAQAQRQRYGRAPLIELLELTGRTPLHVVVNYHEDQLTAYVNGELAFETDEGVSGALAWKYAHLVICGYHGLSGSGSPWDGRIGALALYSRPLDHDEAKRNHALLASRLAE